MLRPLATLTLAAMVMLVGCESKITQENYDKLAKGMTIAEVESILGEGIDYSIQGMDIGGAGISGSGSSGRKTLSYEGDEFNIIIDYDQGKAISIRKR